MFAITFFFCYYDYRLLRIKGVDKMNFDLSWFTTISGMFITGGVILLIIALVILLITGRNSKKEKKKKEMELANVESNMGVNPTNAQPVVGQVPVVDNSVIQNDVVAAQNVNSNIMSAENMVTSVSNVGYNSMSNVPMSGVPNVSDTFGASVPMSVSPEPSVMVAEPVPMQSDQSMSVTPETMNSVPTVDFNGRILSSPVNGFAMPEEPVPVVQSLTPPTMENVPVTSEPSSFDASPVSIPVIGEPAPVTVEPAPMTVEPAPMTVEPAVSTPMSIDSNPIPVVSAPVVDNPIPQVVVPSVSEANPQPIEAAPSGPVIYGGANPAVTDLNVSRENHQIYGGADPLQNTQSIPTTNPTMGPVSNEPVMISQQPVGVVPNVVSNVSESTNQGVPPIAPI